MADHAASSRAALGILGTRVGVYPFKIAVALVVAPLLGSSNYGIYSFLLLPGTLFLPLLTFGAGLGVRYQVSSEKYEAGDVALMALVIGLLHGALTAALFGGLWQYGLLGETGRAIEYELILPVLLVLPLQGVALMSNRLMVGASWFTAVNLYILLNNLLPPVFLLLLVIMGGYGVTGAVDAIVATYIVLAVVSVGMVVVRFRPRFRIEFRFLRLAYGYGLRAWVGSLANRASVRLDQLVLGFTYAPELLGVYRIAVLVTEMLWVVPDAVAIPLFNRISRTADLRDRLKVTMLSHRVLIVVVLLIAVALFATCWWTIPWLLGEDYSDARWLIGILIPGTVSLVTSRLLNMYFNASGAPEKASAVEMVGAVASVVGYLTLIPAFGVAGAAIATSAAYIVIATTARAMFRRVARPISINLFRTSRDDVRWATELVTDSFAIWREKLRRRTLDR